MSKNVACQVFRKCSHSVPRAIYGHISNYVSLKLPRTLQVTLRGHLRRISQQAPTYEPDVTETVVSAIIVENYSEIVETNGGHLTGVSIGSEAMQTTAGDSKQQRRLTTNCTRDSPLTVYAPKLPTVAGCYPKIAVGENGTGIYDSSMRENASRVEYVIGAEGIENGTSSNVSSGFPTYFCASYSCPGEEEGPTAGLR